MCYTLDDLENEREYTEWNFIEFCLWKKDMKIEDLKDIFDVTPQAIDKWKKGEPIAREKKVFLAKFFGVTLDQFYEKETADGYMNKWCYDLSYIVDSKNYKELTERDLELLLEADAKMGWFAEIVLDGQKIDGTVTPGEFDYFCQHLQVSYDYELKDSEKVYSQEYLDFKKLIQIKKELHNSWGDIDLNNKFHYHTRDLIDIILRSENIKFIRKFVDRDVYNTNHNELPVYFKPNLYLDKYASLKKTFDDFDSHGIVLQTLIAEDIVFWTNDKPDYEKTFKYLHKSIRHEIYEKYIEEE